MKYLACCALFIFNSEIMSLFALALIALMVAGDLFSARMNYRRD